MNRRSIAFVVLSTVLALLFLPQKSNAQAIRVTIDFKPELHRNNRQIDFDGKTNLPAGSVVWFRAGPKKDARKIRMRTTSTEIPSGSGSVKTVVQKDGTFKGELKTSGMVKTGKYVCIIEVPVFTYNIKQSTRGQSDDVYQIIGDKGENLIGPLVLRGSNVLGSSCRVEFRREVDFRILETAKIQRKELQKYKAFLNAFKQTHTILLTYLKEGVFSLPAARRNQITSKWYVEFERTATNVEFLTSQDAIDHLRQVGFALYQMHGFSLYPGQKDQEFVDAERKYNEAIQGFEKFVDGIK